MAEARWAVLVLVGLALAAATRDSLRVPGAHGRYRLAAWLAILALLLLNLGSWFVDPASPRQLASWVLLTASLAEVVWGTVLLRRRGRPVPARGHDVPGLLAFESTTVLVTTGIFSCVRHPMYGSLLLLAWGILLKEPTPGAFVLAIAASVLLLLAARAEERENLQRFGPAYAQYMRRTRRFVPWLF